MKSDRLFSRDFTLMVIGQIISLLGNAVLRFALPLQVLDATGSAAAFGGVLALSMVPVLLCSPLGGVLADRVPRQRIMWGLDFFTATLAAGYGLLGGVSGGAMAAITALAAGAILAMIADTMIPEAFRKAQALTGLVTVLGFVASYAVHQAG